MGEPFYAIGFKVTDEASYQALAEEAHHRGTLSKARRSQGVLHGCCWSLGAGLEVWTVLYESKEGLFYADCRPGFRSQHIFNFYPWEIVEYEEEGEAVARGVTTDSETEMIFQLQNITEVNPNDFHEHSITAAVSGLAYRAQITTRNRTPAFTPLTSRYTRRKVAENDYAVCGSILSWREIKNQHTTSDLIWTSLDVGRIKLEVLVNRADLKGELKQGRWLSAEVWLQGHILNERELKARYEGVDRDIPSCDYWSRLRREH
jgi:Domain of unknown function, E. rectale Gene description (DUF3881)